MDTKTLIKLSPEGRKEILAIEKRFNEIKAELESEGKE